MQLRRNPNSWCGGGGGPSRSKEMSPGLTVSGDIQRCLRNPWAPTVVLLGTGCERETVSSLRIYCGFLDKSKQTQTKQLNNIGINRIKGESFFPSQFLPEAITPQFIVWPISCRILHEHKHTHTHSLRSYLNFLNIPEISIPARNGVVHSFSQLYTSSQ